MRSGGVNNAVLSLVALVTAAMLLPILSWAESELSADVPDTTVWGRDRCTPYHLRHVHEEMFDWRILAAEFELGNVRRCRMIVRGLVTGVTTERIDDGLLAYADRGGWFHSRTVVDLSVEERMKGVCPDSISFYAIDLSQPIKVQLGGGPEHFREPLRYKEGEHVTVLLDWHEHPIDGRVLSSVTVYSKYLIDDEGIVVRKGIPASDFLPALRAVVEARSPRRLLEESDCVFLCEVESMCEIYRIRDWDPLRRHSQLRNWMVTLSRDRYIKATVDATTRFTVDVGPYESLDGVDAPEFEMGEKVLVFVRRRADGFFEIVGGYDGKHRLGDSTTDEVLKALPPLNRLPH